MYSGYMGKKIYLEIVYFSTFIIFCGYTVQNQTLRQSNKTCIPLLYLTDSTYIMIELV